jgi:hypothetical protein
LDIVLELKSELRHHLIHN